MANDWFRFKQFTINQSGSAMKVGTDGVLLGAWARIPEGCSEVLDIGTGTGLLSLMLAQKFTDSNLMAVEIDQDSVIQANENFQNSKWKDRISLREISFQDFSLQISQKYDLIISNPPYFKDSLQASDSSRSIARHQFSLSLEELFSGVKNILNSNGYFSLILPADQKMKCLSLAKEVRLFPQRILHVRPNPDKKFIRVLIEFSFSMKDPSEHELIIEKGKRHEYSDEYIELTRDFYLKF